MWTQQPVVHLLPHWDWPGCEGQIIRVVGYTNGKQAYLYLNGELIGSQSVPMLGHIEWDLTYEPGELELRVQFDDGQEYSSSRHSITGAYALHIEPLQPELRIGPDGLAMCAIEVRDMSGKPVSTATNRIQVMVSAGGCLLGVGNGDPGEHQPEQGNERLLFSGKAMALIQGMIAGPITVTVTSPGLVSVHCCLNVITEEKAYP